MADEWSLGLRMLILLAGALLWLGQYFLINRLNPRQRPHNDWALEIDRKIPFLPQVTPVYMSTYLFGLLPFILVSEKRLFTLLVLAYVLITFISGVIHLVFPSRVDRVEDPGTGEFHLGVLNWYQRLCMPYDNFPSTHVAFSIVVAGTGFLSRGAVLGWALSTWAFSIALSTLFTKQHYVLDILTGWLLGMAIFGMVWLVY